MHSPAGHGAVNEVKTCLIKGIFFFLVCLFCLFTPHLSLVYPPTQSSRLSEAGKWVVFLGGKI